MCPGSYDRKCFAISIALSILSINIIVFGILPMAPLFGIKKSRFLKLALRIRLTIYIKFRQLNGCLYIRNGGKSFNKTRIYSKIFDVTIADNKTIKIVGNLSFK